MSSIIENPAFFTIDNSDPTLRVVKVNQSGIDTEDQANPNESPIFGVNQSDATVDVQIESPKGAITVQVNTGAGDDTIAGAFIADTINAGAGDDLVEGYKGADRLSGGDDDDTLYGDSVAAATNPSIVKDGNDTIFGGAGNDLIFGGDGDDELYGDDGNDTLFGGAGDDKLFGGAGDDSLDGGDGNDKLFGGAGNDVLVGGAGNDTLDGGAGADTLTGGTGADVFRILESDDAVDNITDFTQGEDMIKVIGFGSTDTVTAEDGKVKVNGTELADFDPSGTLDLTATFNATDNVWEIL